MGWLCLTIQEQPAHIYARTQVKKVVRIIFLLGYEPMRHSPIGFDARLLDE